MKFYKCDKCGNVLFSMNEKCDGLTCCGKDMKELIPRGVDGALEKHVPVVFEEEGVVTVKVGEVEHPMTEEHYIEFIVVETNRSIHIKRLQPGDKPQASFILNDEDVVNTVAYCNLHGLWNS